MPIKALVARGVGFSPGSVKYIPTLGLSIGADPGLSWTAEADFDFDGTYETDLQPYMDVGGPGFAIDRGIGPDGRYRVSTIELSLSNRDGTFTPDNWASSLPGPIRAHVPVRVIATLNGTAYTRWTGYVRRFAYNWDAANGPASNRNRVRLSASDIASYLVGSEPVHVAASTSRDTDAAIQAILEALGLTSVDWNLDDGVQALPMHYVVAQDAMSAIMDVIVSEMGGFGWVTTDGKWRFESRSRRLGSTPAQTWGDGTAVTARHCDYVVSQDYLINTVRARATLFRTGQADLPIFRWSRGMHTKPTADSLYLAPGEVYERVFNTESAYASLTTPEARKDYLANSAIDGSGTDRTSSLSYTATALGGGQFRGRWANTSAVNGLYITMVQLRGQPVVFFADRPMAEMTKAVPGLKANTGADIDLPFSGDTGNKMRDYAYQLLRTYRYDCRSIALTFKWTTDDIRSAMLTADIGDLVYYQDTDAGNASGRNKGLYYIEGIKESGSVGRFEQSVVTLTPAEAFRNLDKIGFDVFDRSNATGDLGTSTQGLVWADDGNFDIASNRARANSTAAQSPVLTIGATDMVVEVNLHGLTGDADARAGVCYRKSDASNQWRAYIDRTLGEIVLAKVVAGVTTVVASVAWTAVASGELRVIAQGNRHRVWWNFELVIDEEDSALAANTKAGLYSENTTSVELSDFYAQGLSA